MAIEKFEYQNLLNELVVLIEKTKTQVISHVNSSLTVLFWHVENRILTDNLQNKRAEYGKQIVVTVSRELVERFGKNYEEKNLRRMIQFAEKYPDIENVVTLSRHLSWSHFLALIPLKEQGARDFYGNLAYGSLIGVRELRKQIEQKVHERTENANIQIYDSNKIEKGIFKDPYFLDFLELKDGYLENDLEAAILKELELFILELGNGFTFVERQKRMIIDGDDFNLDLLFYHRKLKRLVAIELKIDKFKAKHKGQMELYLKWLDKYEKQEGEKSPIGLILCAVARLKKDNKMEQFVTKENKRKPTHKQHICNSHKPTHKPKIAKELFFAIAPLDNNDKFLTPNVKIFDTNKIHKPPTVLNILHLQYWHCDC